MTETPTDKLEAPLGALMHWSVLVAAYPGAHTQTPIRGSPSIVKT